MSCSLEADATGDVVRLACGQVEGAPLDLGRFTPTLHESTVAGIHLRRRTGDRADHAQLTGSAALADPSAHVRVGPDHITWEREALGARSRVVLSSSADGFRWDVELAAADAGEPSVGERTEYDLVLVQDVGLAPADMVRTNALYVSHYVTHHVITGETGGAGTGEPGACPVTAVASRQTMVFAPALPLAVSGWTGGARGVLTDGSDLPEAFGSWEWGTEVRQGEHGLAALTSASLTLDQPVRRSAFTAVHADYRGALDEAPLPQLSTPAPVPPDAVGADTANADRIARSLLASAQPLAGTDLRPAELEVLAGTGRAVERDATGAPLSWFDAADADAPARHTATGTKERLVARPHGAILLSADALEPAIPQLTATTWAGGVFAAHLAFGNTNEHRVLGIHRGVRILVRGRGGDGDAGWNRLTVPSLWESDLGRTRWTYRILGGTLTVTTTIGSGTPALALTVDTDLDVDLRLVLELDPDGEDWEVVQRDTRTLSVTSSQRRAAYLLEGTGDWADDAELWEDGTARDRATWVLAPSSADGARVTFAAGTDPVEAAATLAATGDTDPADWASAHHRAIGRLTRDLRLPADGPYAEFDLLVPWFAHDALVHLLAPHGLEQSSGAAWGTRDVCQGPFEFALAFGHLDACRDLLLRIFAHQLPSGDWPQWFMYDEYRDIHAPDSHGDVAVWPLVALAEYLQASGDLSVLDETVPYLDAPIEDEYPIRNHLQRQLDHLDSHRVPGSALPAYGHGDWDDTLQPADDSLRDSMASTWTAALLAGVTRDLGALLESSDRAIAERLHTTAEALGGLLRGELLVDGVMPGFVRLVDGETIPVIHPRDETTGLHYRLISLTQGVLSGVLGADAAEAQIRTVGERLLAPDGAHLMDRPVAWHEGRTTLFRRAEQSAFFGREVGLMYTHAHLRWVETLAAWGRGDALEQLLQISPVGIGERLGDRALPRQRNCYYSSSDAAFPTRDEASAEWDRVSAGEVDVAGGWRIYSSGPGIVLRVLVQDLLGVRLHGDEVVLDPLLPEGSDRTKFTIAVAEDGPALAVEVQRDPSAVPGSVRVTVDDRAVETRPVTGAYRDRGVAVPASALEGVGRIEARVG